MPNTKTGTTWAPDIRPEKIETFEETYTPEGGEQQIIEYRAVNHHPILNKVLDKMAFFRTHVGAIWYNLAERKTLLTKLNELDAELREVNAKTKPDKIFSGSATAVNTEYALNQDVSKYSRFSVRISWGDNIFLRVYLENSDIDNICGPYLGITGSNFAENMFKFKITSKSKLVITFKGYSGASITEILGIKS